MYVETDQVRSSLNEASTRLDRVDSGYHGESVGAQLWATYWIVCYLIDEFCNIRAELRAKVIKLREEAE